MKRLITYVLLLLPLPLLGQASRYNGTIYTINASSPLPNALYPVLASSSATVAICSYPATGFTVLNAATQSISNGCTNYATTYTNAVQTAQCAAPNQLTRTNSTTCVGKVDAEGNFGAWLVSGNYQYTVTLSYGSFGPYDFSVGGSGGGGAGNPALPFTACQFNNGGIFGGSSGCSINPLGDIETRSYDGIFNAFKMQTTPTSNDGIANALNAINTFVTAGTDYASVEAIYGSGLCPNFRLAIGCPPPWANGTELFDYRPGIVGSYLYNPNMVATEFKFDRIVSNQQAQTTGGGVSWLPFRQDMEISGWGINGFNNNTGPDSNGYSQLTMETMRQGIMSVYSFECQCYSMGDFQLNNYDMTFNRGTIAGSDEGQKIERTQIQQNTTPMAMTANSTLAAGATVIPGTLISPVPFTATGTYLIDATKGGAIKHIVSNIGPNGSGPQSAGQWTVDGAAMTPDTFCRVASAVATPMLYGGATTNETVNASGCTAAITTAATVCYADHQWQETARVISAGSLSGGNQTLTLALMYPHDVNAYIAQGSHACDFVEARANEVINGTSYPGRNIGRIIGADGAHTYRYAITGAGNWVTWPTGMFSTSIVAAAGTTLTRNTNVVTVAVTDPNLNLSGIGAIVSGCTDSTYNGTFTVTADNGSAVTWNNSGSNGTTTCTNAVEILSRENTFGVREMQEFPGSEITNGLDATTHANSFDPSVQPNTNLQVTAGDQMEDHIYNQTSIGIHAANVDFLVPTSPSLGQIMENFTAEDYIPEGITIYAVQLQEQPIHYQGLGGTKPILGTLFSMANSFTPLENLFNLTSPTGTAFQLNGCVFTCTDSRSHFTLLDISTAFPDMTWVFHQDTNTFETNQLSASSRLTIDYSPASWNLVMTNGTNGVIQVVQPSFWESIVQGGGGSGLTINQTTTTLSLTQAGAFLPQFQMVGVSDGCATFSGGFLGSTGSACGAGGGSPLTTKGDLFGFSTVGTRIPVGTNGQVLTADSTNANGVSWQPVGAGTVTSIAMTVPSILNIAGSPITTSGTLAVTLANQNANLVFAGPTSGGAATPTFRALVSADLPTITGVPWSGLANPTGNLALTMGANTTTFTYNATTSTANLMKWTDTASNTGTGILGWFTTASGSAAIPWQADNNGLGWKVAPTTGALTGIGSSNTHGISLPASSSPLGAAASTGVITTDSSGDVLVSHNNGPELQIVGATLPSAPLTDGATVTWAIGSNPLANANLVFTTHGGSRTLNLTGLVNGGFYALKLKQDATGGEGLTLGTGCTWIVINGGGGAITPSTGAGAVDVLAFYYDGTFCTATFGKNYN